MITDFLSETRNWPLFYSLVGIGYWAVNIFIRKLHTKNEPGDSWFLGPLWLLMWPICFLALATDAILKFKQKLF
jgi:hypothetical protein